MSAMNCFLNGNIIRFTKVNFGQSIYINFVSDHYSILHLPMLTSIKGVVLCICLTLANRLNSVKVSIKPEYTTISLGDLSEIKVKTYRSKNTYNDFVDGADNGNFIIGDPESCENGDECKITQLVSAHQCCV